MVATFTLQMSHYTFQPATTAYFPMQLLLRSTEYLEYIEYINRYKYA